MAKKSGVSIPLQNNVSPLNGIHDQVQHWFKLHFFDGLTYEEIAINYRGHPDTIKNAVQDLIKRMVKAG